MNLVCLGTKYTENTLPKKDVRVKSYLCGVRAIHRGLPRTLPIILNRRRSEQIFDTVDAR